MAASNPSSRAYFEQQREALMGEIAMVILKANSIPHLPPSLSPSAHPVTAFILTQPTQSFEQVLANINKLNRNLEAVITVGNEFSSVEALWSTFENVMAKEEGEGDEGAEGKAEEAGAGGDDEAQRGQDDIKADDEEQDRTLT